MGLEGIHLEVKRVERFSIYDAVEQSERDARDGEVPTVMYRKNNKGWLVILRAEDLIPFAQAILDSQDVQ